jgi:O-antigen/teichoic acid export membrane protein
VTDIRLNFGIQRPVRSGGKNQPSRNSLFSEVTASWRRHKDLLVNAASLVASTVATSGLGFAYWAVAARLFSQREVGYGSAALSSITLLGTIGMFGLGTVLIGELPRRREGRGGLAAAALLVSGTGSLVLGLGFVVVAPHLSKSFGETVGTPGRAALFAAGVILTGTTLVLDQATIGLMRGGLQLSRNIVTSVAKLLILPATTWVLHDGVGAGITFSWVAGTVLSLIPLAVRLRLSGVNVLPSPDWGVLRGLGKTALAHNWLNLAVSVPWMLLPVIVTVIVSPAANAAFYVAWQLTNFLYIIPTHLSTVLFAIAAAEPQAVTRKLRFVLRLSFIFGLPGMVILGLGAHLALSVFGAAYARTATLALWLLIIGYLPAVPRSTYIAVCRADGKVARAAAVLTSSAIIKLTLAAVGGMSGGLKGLSFGLLGGALIEGLVTSPAVIHKAIGTGRHRLSNGTPAAKPGPSTIAEIAAASKEANQQAGVAALIALANPEIVNRPSGAAQNTQSRKESRYTEEDPRSARG